MNEFFKNSSKGNETRLSNSILARYDGFYENKYMIGFKPGLMI